MLTGYNDTAIMPVIVNNHIVNEVSALDHAIWQILNGKVRARETQYKLKPSILSVLSQNQSLS